MLTIDDLDHPAHLICENEEVAQKMTENLEKEQQTLSFS